MFDPDFYPTPLHVIESMGFDCTGKVVLEPSAGKGDIVDYLVIHGASKVLVCEKNKDLAEIIKTKAQFIGSDFLKVYPEDISHIQMIVMNPPFSDGASHILHAWEIAPDGCEIYSLINANTVHEYGAYSRERRQLLRIIEENGSAEYMGKVFSDAERQTDVEVSLVKLYKQPSGASEFDGFFLDEDPDGEVGNGIVKFDVVRNVVQRYVNAVKCFEEHLIIQEKMNGLVDIFRVGSFGFSINSKDVVVTKEGFKKSLQKEAWKYLFGIMNIEKYVTTEVRKKINKFVENQTKVPFTMKNIYHMLSIIVGTSEETFNNSLVEAIEKFTKHTHENRYELEGWKTNSGHMLNRKFIVGTVLEHEYTGYLHPRWSSYNDGIEDLIKVTCAITGIDYKSIPHLRDFCREVKLAAGVWYDWQESEDVLYRTFMNRMSEKIGSFVDKDEFFELYKDSQYYKDQFAAQPIPCLFQIKGFKKGTLHMKFKEEKVWEAVNRKYAKIKGQVLPEKMNSK